MSRPVDSRAGDDGISAIRDGDRDAFNAQVGRWVYRIYDVALSIVGSTAAAVEVSRETIESLWDRHRHLSAADLTRDSLLIATRERALSRRTFGNRQEISTTNEHVVLTRAAAVVLGVEEVSYLDLYLRHGVSADALAPVLGVASDAVSHRFALSRADLGEAMAAYSLWHQGRPDCVELATILGDTTEFDASTSESIERHRQACSECARRHRSLVNPERLFIAAPIVAIAPAIRERIVATAATTGASGDGGSADTTIAVADLDDVWAPAIHSTPRAAAAVVPGGRSVHRGRPHSWLRWLRSSSSEALSLWLREDRGATSARSAVPRFRRRNSILLIHSTKQRPPPSGNAPVRTRVRRLRRRRRRPPRSPQRRPRWPMSCSPGPRCRQRPRRRDHERPRQVRFRSRHPRRPCRRPFR